MDIQASRQKKQWDTPSVTSLGSIEQLTGFGWLQFWGAFPGGRGKGNCHPYEVS